MSDRRSTVRALFAGAREEARRHMHRHALLALLVFTPAAWPQAAGDDSNAIDVIGECISAAEDEIAGLAALESACPGVTQALGDSGYLDLLAPAERDALSPHELSELQRIRARYREPSTSVRIEVSSLASILESLQPPHAQQPPTWLERFKRWLRSKFERSANADSWLSQWLENVTIPQRVSHALIYGSILFIILLAIIVVVNELRVAGLLRKRQRHATTQPDAARAAGATVEAHAAREPGSAEAQIGLLLEVLITTLLRDGRLQTERSLTHRELGLRATFDDTEQRRCFQLIAALAERAVYDARPIPPQELEPAMAAGRALHARLGGSAA